MADELLCRIFVLYECSRIGQSVGMFWGTVAVLAAKGLRKTPIQCVGSVQNLQCSRLTVELGDSSVG
jgi:hypothetical protein